ncbi:MAG: hypothetical protein ABSC06_32105 [Rhodopila sp.]|jgi:hypothetical protein
MALNEIRTELGEQADYVVDDQDLPFTSGGGADANGGTEIRWVMARARTRWFSQSRTRRPGWCRGHATLDDAKPAVITGWDAARQAHPEDRQIMLAFRSNPPTKYTGE